MARNLLLDGKIAVITGGAAGIGGGTSRVFASEGATVILNDVDAGLAAAAKAQIEGDGGRVVTVVGDIRERGDHRASAHRRARGR